MKAIDLRVREETLALARALCDQRALERAALLREALDVGLLLLAASGPPVADDPTDIYGTLTASRLTQLLRPRLAPALDFLSRYGAAPHIGSYAAPPAVTPPVASDPRPRGPAFSVDNAIDDVLDSFGIDLLGED
jgi:hypothetical protein